MARTPGEGRRGRLQGHALSTLRHRNFRLIWIGQIVATLGLQMQQVTIAWHLYVMTDSTLQVGLVGAFGIVPFMILSFVGGTIADKFDRRRVLMVTQSMTMCTALVLFGTTMAGIVTPAVIYAIAFVSGMTRAFDAPARQSLIPNLVPREELGNALAMNTMMRQLATVAGPSLGGVILGFGGIGPAYAANALCVVVILISLAIMDPVAAPARQRGSNFQLALGGLRFVKGEPVVFSILCLDWLATFLGSTRALMPAFARDILEVGPQGLGLLYAAPGIGAVTGALVLGAIGMRFRQPAAILAVVGIFGLFVAGFGLSRFFPLSLVMLFGTGFADVFGEVIRQTLVQLRTPDELRGRVTALSVIFTNGGPQLGQLQAGAVASVFGPGEAAVIGGCGVMIAATLFALNPHMRITNSAPPQEQETGRATQPASGGG